jgi:dihydrofolate reductase
MGQLVYFATASIDGYIEDRDGGFGWAEPSEEVHAFVNDLVRPVRTFLYGRRMYETMQGWETEPSLAEGNAVTADFAALWIAAEKVVYSSTLTAPVTTKTLIEPSFDAGAVRSLVDAASTDVGIGGATLAAEAFRAGLVAEVQLLLVPTAVGGGIPALPQDHRLDLELFDLRRFDNGSVLLRYHVR